MMLITYCIFSKPGQRHVSVQTRALPRMPLIPEGKQSRTNSTCSQTAMSRAENLLPQTQQ